MFHHDLLSLLGIGAESEEKQSGVLLWSWSLDLGIRFGRMQRGKNLQLVYLLVWQEWHAGSQGVFAGFGD